MAEWGHSTPQDRDNNLNGLSTKWQPSQGVKQLFRRGKEAIAYSVETGHKIPDNIIVDKLIRVINGSQAYKEAYKSFKSLGQHDQNFVLLKNTFQGGRTPACKESDDTAQYREYSMNAEEVAIEGATKGQTDLSDSLQKDNEARQRTTASCRRSEMSCSN